MADENLNNLFDTYTGVTENSKGTTGSTLNTGDLLRTFNFGNQLARLEPQIDPLMSFLSRLKKKHTNDPEFKYAEERDLTHVRYGYVLGASADDVVTTGAALANYVGVGIGSSQIAKNTKGNTYSLVMGTDYKWSGNIASVYGNANNKVDILDAGTQPKVFVVGQLLKIPIKTTKDSTTAGAEGASAPHTYQVVEITGITYGASDNATYLDVRVVGEASGVATTGYFTTTNPAGGANADVGRALMIDQVGYSLYDKRPETIKGLRSIVIGTAHAMGSGVPEGFLYQPISTGYGMTQIFKNALKMDNTSRATEYRYKKNSFLYNWKKTLLKHKWDIAHTGVWGKPWKDTSGDKPKLYTQGFVDYVNKYGNIFSLDYANDGIEKFMGDIDIFFNDVYLAVKPTIFFCDSVTWNWTLKASGLYTNSIDDLNAASANTPFSHNFQSIAFKEFFGVKTNVISTPAGEIKLVKNKHLDGSNIAILGVNLNNARFRPLRGNGINRDTRIIPAVKSLEKDGEDRRVDLIQTEAGFEWRMPESHAIWTKANMSA